MAIILLAAGRWPVLDDVQDKGKGPSAWVRLISHRPVDDTVRLIQRAARRMQMAVVAQAPADRLPGLKRVLTRTNPPGALQSMPLVLVLGDADGHTPAFQTDRQAVPDLPLKVLLQQRPDGRTEVLYADPHYVDPHYIDPHDAAPHGLRRDAGAPTDWRNRLAALPRVIQLALT